MITLTVWNAAGLQLGGDCVISPWNWGGRDSFLWQRLGGGALGPRRNQVCGAKLLPALAGAKELNRSTSMLPLNCSRRPPIIQMHALAYQAVSFHPWRNKVREIDDSL